MRTIQFTGTDNEMENLHLALSVSDNNMPQQSEIIVYTIDTLNLRIDWMGLSDEEFINLAEEHGNIYTLEGFTEAFNLEDVNPEIDVIRFITVPLF